MAIKYEFLPQNSVAPHSLEVFLNFTNSTFVQSQTVPEMCQLEKKVIQVLVLIIIHFLVMHSE